VDKEKIEHLEKVGLEAVLIEIAQRKHGQPDSPLRKDVEAWVESKKFALDSASSDKRDFREDKTLRIAIVAIVIATISMIIQIFDKLF